MDSEDEDVERGFDVYGTQRVDMDNFITFDEDDGDEQEVNDDSANKNQDQQQQHRLQKQQQQGGPRTKQLDENALHERESARRKQQAEELMREPLFGGRDGVLSQPLGDVDWAMRHARHQQHQHAGPASSSSSTAAAKQPKAKHSQRSALMDSDEEDLDDLDEVDDGNSDGKGTSLPQPTNDELLYDPAIDDENEVWVKEMRARATQGQVAHTQNVRQGLAPVPDSDAVLNCPACLTPLCLDCQRHDLYPTQFRAMFVMNCSVDHSKVRSNPYMHQTPRTPHHTTHADTKHHLQQIPTQDTQHHIHVDTKHNTTYVDTKLNTTIHATHQHTSTIACLFLAVIQLLLMPLHPSSLQPPPLFPQRTPLTGVRFQRKAPEQRPATAKAKASQGHRSRQHQHQHQQGR